MAKVQRRGDANTLGGVIVGGDTSVLVNGRPIAVPDLSVTSHYPCGKPNCGDCRKHCNATTKVSGSRSVRASGKPIIVTGDSDTCTCQRTGGSTDVLYG